MSDERGDKCPACNADVVGAGVAPGGPLRCDRCGTRFPKAKKAVPAVAEAHPGARQPEDVLGIHPALAKKYTAALPQAPKPQKETRVLDGGAQGVPSQEGVAVAAQEHGTAPARPAARNSMPTAPVAAAKPPPPPPPAEELPAIPGYQVMELIGKGAMGRVYRAKHTASGRMAAIKTLAPELAVRPDFVARFEREGAAMRAIRHPGVVQVWDQGKAGTDIYYISMEFISGHPLRKSLERGPLHPLLALRYTRLILQALQAAHTPGVIHRDLKPENILMHGAAGHEKPVLVDFGLAGIMAEENDPHPNLTKSRMTMGTVNYMAPEQRTDAKRVDQRADLYAAGVILYELLTGDLPLGRFALPTERGVKAPASVDRLIIKALARAPEERFQHARDFDAALAVIEAEIKADAAAAKAVKDIDDVLDDGNKNDTVVGNDTAPGRPARDLRRESSEPGIPSLTPAFSGAPSVGTAIDNASIAAWATMLPTVQMKTIGGVFALMVGTLLGLLLLRGL
jgi:serine/threonine protein kinase